MKIHSIAESILPHACPSIQYRIRKEILREPAAHTVMCDLQDQIIRDGSVKKVSATQSADGWLAWSFHGYGSMESGIRLMCEKGVEADHPVLAHALTALKNSTDRLERGLGKSGKILDERRFGGGETIRASLFAQAGKEDQDFVKEQIQQALDVFAFSAAIHSLDEIQEQYKHQLVFRPGIRWPGIYHLRLLAWTKNWRTAGNCKMIRESIQNLVRLSPIPELYVKYKSQAVAPASFCMHDFTQDLNQLSSAQWMQWFHRMELLSRLGVVHQIHALEQQVCTLENMLLHNQGLFPLKLNHPYFQKWGAYTGLALEKDWRSSRRRINDLTFRSLLILNHSGF